MTSMCGLKTLAKAVQPTVNLVIKILSAFYQVRHFPMHYWDHLLIKYI